MIRKPAKIRSKEITRSAEGEACQLRTPYCNGNPETVVLCHAPGGGSGVATKGDDTWAAYGCSSCHKFLDEHASMEVAIIQYWYPAIRRTQKRLYEKGITQIK